MGSSLQMSVVFKKLTLQTFVLNEEAIRDRFLLPEPNFLSFFFFLQKPMFIISLFPLKSMFPIPLFAYLKQWVTLVLFLGIDTSEIL